MLEMSINMPYCRCSAVEQKMNISEGVLKKEVKTKEQKQKDLEEVMTGPTSQSSRYNYPLGESGLKEKVLCIPYGFQFLNYGSVY